MPTSVQVPVTSAHLDQVRSLMRSFIVAPRHGGWFAGRLRGAAPDRRLGFRPIEPYYEVPEDMKNWLVFMELTL